MVRPILFLLAGLAGGFVVAALWPGDSGLAPRSNGAAEVRELPDRLAALERQIEEERVERMRVEQDLAAVRDELARLSSPAHAGEVAAHEDLLLDAAAAADVAPPAAEVPERTRFGRQRGRVDIADALVAGGFSLDRAGWIERRLEELRVEAMQAAYEARREGAAFGPRSDLNASLRAELGDAEYERYLEAMDRPTRVEVGSVLASSAAEAAGLEPGDEIYSYAGKRVFDTQNLDALQLEGEPGEPVMVELMRDGQVVQLTLPRGPIGITSGRFRGRPGGGLR